MSQIDEPKQAENEEVGQNDLETSPVSEQEAPEETVEAEAESTEEAEVEAEETGGEQKKGYEKRVRSLVDKVKKAEEENKSLADALAELTAQRESNQETPSFEPQIQPGSEVSPEQYKNDIVRTADAIATLRIKQADAINRINNEAQEVIRQYPELDPESDSFNSELSEAVTEAVEASVKANPYSASVKSVVAKMMKPYKGAVAKEVGEATEDIAKKVSGAALRPTSINKEEKTAEDMTIEELESKLGVIQS